MSSNALWDAALDGMSPGEALWDAAIDGATERVRHLIAGKVDLEWCVTSNETTPLLMAVSQGHEACVRLLLEAGANTEGQANKEDGSNDGDNTPLILAATYGHEACVRLLIGAGANREAAQKYSGSTPLILAATNGHEASVRLLLEAGANKEAKKKEDGETALDCARERGHTAVVALLEGRGPPSCAEIAEAQQRQRQRQLQRDADDHAAWREHVEHLREEADRHAAAEAKCNGKKRKLDKEAATGSGAAMQPRSIVKIGERSKDRRKEQRLAEEERTRSVHEERKAAFERCSVRCVCNELPCKWAGQRLCPTCGDVKRQLCQKTACYADRHAAAEAKWKAAALQRQAAGVRQLPGGQLAAEQLTAEQAAAEAAEVEADAWELFAQAGGNMDG